MTAWQTFVEKWKNCTLCPLHTQRDRIVLARGKIPADIMLVGEAPGASENAIGVPFCGPAGRLLDQIVEKAIPLSISVVYCNLVCCFPADAKREGVNEPSHKEITACSSRLAEFVNLARPRLIVRVGALAAYHVDHTDTVRCADVVHPAAILRMPLAQRQMATQKSIVIIRNAVADMLESGSVKFTKWGEEHASSKS